MSVRRRQQRRMIADIIPQRLVEATKENPCPHCGKPDWCYQIGELSICNRKEEPAPGWERTSKRDRTGKTYYAPALPKKGFRPQGKSEFIYHSRDGQPLIKITRIDDGNGKKKIFQSHWDGKNWNKGLTEETKKAIPVYRYAEVTQAIAEGKPIFMVEGESIADQLWQLGLAATTTIGGAGKYRAYGSYQQDLEGAILVLCPDRDTPGLAHMEDINEDFPDSKWLYAPPSDFYWSHLPKSGGLDIKDWVSDGATADQILEAIEDRRVIVDLLEEAFSLDPAKESNPSRSKLKEKFNAIQAVWGHRLQWNLLKKQIELDGKRLTLDRIKIKIAREIEIDISREDAKEIVLELAHERSYSPVIKYLERVALRYPATSSQILDQIAPKYFGTADPLHAALMRRTMIAAVARAFDPGCKHDNITILQGNQGFLKSTFWETLAGREFFTDDIISGSEKDEILKVSQYWLLEYAEFETAYRKKEVSQLKSFLSRRHDSIRRPYGSDIEDFHRPSIFVGTTNRSEFLHDPTGERRFWVIPCLKKIDIAALKEERDLLWAAAIAAYRSGEQWYLTDSEDLALKAANEQYQAADSWEEAIASYLLNRSFTVVGDILSEVLKLELAKQDRASEMRVAEVLRRLGWEKSKQRRINGKPRWVWEPKIKNEDVTLQNLDTATVSASIPQKLTEQPLLEVVTPLNPDTVSNVENKSIVSQPIESKLPDFSETGEKFSPTPPLIAESPRLRCDTPPPLDPQIQPQQEMRAEEVPVTTHATNIKPTFELTQTVVDMTPPAQTSKPLASSTPSELVIRVGEKADYCGEEVTIVGWENNGSKIQIEFSKGSFQMVKRGSLKPIARKDL